jgi:hypothetical protein
MDLTGTRPDLLRGAIAGRRHRTRVDDDIRSTDRRSKSSRRVHSQFVCRRRI